MIKEIINPPKEEWSKIIEKSLAKEPTVEREVKEILQSVKNKGDEALKEYATRFDRVLLNSLKVSEEEIKRGVEATPIKLKEAISIAIENIRKFHLAQINNESYVETTKGIICWRENRAIDRVGLYVPGGSAPLFSTLLMTGIPAKIAGCSTIIVTTPCNSKGEVDPTLLYAAKRIGITEIYKVGGAQAIAAMSYGTNSVPKVYKIFGPGNKYVTKAKELVMLEGVAIDMPAGPSELLIIADESANVSYIAADLLSQAEHGADSRVVLATDNPSILLKVKKELEHQILELPREAIAREALKKASLICFETLERAIEFSNLFAPEHLILAVKNARDRCSSIKNAGSVFLGNYSCESIGDYASGTNHTLPTAGYAKQYSGLSLESFQKRVTFQKISPEGLKNIGTAVEIMADAEGLFAHKNAVTIRLKDLAKEN